MTFLSTIIKPGQKNAGLLLHDEDGFFVITNDDQSIIIRLQKRDAYPGTYCHHLSDGTFQFGYGDSDCAPESEFLQCVVTASGDIRIHRDAYGTLPLFYGSDDETFALSSTYEDMPTLFSTVTLSQRGLLESLAVELPMSTTYIEEVSVLWQDEVLEYNQGLIKIIPPAPRPWQKSVNAPSTNPLEFKQEFDSYLDRFIDTRLNGQTIAFEMSGGLDSATLHQYYAHKYGSNKTMIWAASLLHAGSFAETQGQKIRQLLHVTGNQFAYQILDNPSRVFPLSRMVAMGQYHPTYYEKTYYEPNLVYVQQLAAEGVKVICTGTGGDELFGNVVAPNEHTYGARTRRHRQMMQLPAYLTDTFRAAYVDSTPSQPKPLARRSLSLNYTPLCYGIYIDNGIWPVSPFTSPDLYTWVQGLPVHYRANKNILRAYHQAHGFIPEIYQPTQNEDFTEYFEDCIQAGVYDELVSMLLKNAVSVKAGYVNAGVLLAMYRHLRTEAYSDQDAFAIYMWIVTEINAQYVVHKLEATT